MSAALRTDLQPAGVRHFVAVHEAGHAIVCMMTGLMPRSLSIVQRGNTGGGVSISHQMNEGRNSDIDTLVQQLLAGRAAAELIFAGAGGGGAFDPGCVTATISEAVAASVLGRR